MGMDYGLAITMIWLGGFGIGFGIRGLIDRNK